jgi:hypothetical protein
MQTYRRKEKPTHSREGPVQVPQKILDDALARALKLLSKYVNLNSKDAVVKAVEKQEMARFLIHRLIIAYFFAAK